MPNDVIRDIFIDNTGTKWIASISSIIKFDNENWTVWDHSHSDLPNDYYNSIAVDKYGNKWIGTERNGIVVFKEGGVDSVVYNNNYLYPLSFTLLQNYPNPFNSGTTITYKLKNPDHMRLDIYNTLGQHVTTLVNHDMDEGLHRVRWNSQNAASGVYFYRLIVGKKFFIKKMMLLR